MTEQSFAEVARQAVADADAVIVDVRSDDEWAAGHADRAIHWDITRLERGEMPGVPKDARVYTYCGSGGRAGRAQQMLAAQGWTEVKNLGGLRDWQSAGGAVSNDSLQ